MAQPFDSPRLQSSALQTVGCEPSRPRSHTFIVVVQGTTEPDSPPVNLISEVILASVDHDGNASGPSASKTMPFTLYLPFARNVLFLLVICTMEEVRNVRPSISIRILLGEANIPCSKSS